MTETIEAAAEIVRARAGAEPVETVIVLGSGLGSTMDNALEGQVTIPYADLPGFPTPTVPGHEGRLAIGLFEGERIACMIGREHYYERGDTRAMAAAFGALAMVGARTLLLTSSVGSVNADLPPSTLVCIVDHINLSGVNPLVGQGSEPGFVSLADAYDSRLVKRLRRASVGAGVQLKDAVYMYFPGPSFETPAEIRAAKALGADVVGMSLPPEVVLARRLGLRVAALSMVTNFGAGFQGGSPSHDQTRQVALQGSIALKRVIRGYFKARDEAWGLHGREHLR